MPPPNTMIFQPDLPSHLKMQRLTEDLTSAQKKLKEYEDLFSALYHNACEHCKACFQRIAGAGTSLAARAIPYSGSDCICSLSALGSSAQPVGHRTPKRQLLEPSTDGYGPTNSHIPKRPRISCSIGQHGASTSRNCAPQALSSQPDHSDASRHGFPTTSTKPADPKVSTTPPGGKTSQAQYSVEFPVGKSKLKVERVWTLETADRYASVKFSPDGRYLAVGLVETRSHSTKTYIIDVTTGRKICFADRHPLRGYFTCYLSFSPGDGRYLATAHWSANTMIWEVGKKRVRNAFACRAIDTCADFSPDGRSVVISSGSGNFGVRIRSMRDGSSICLCNNNKILAVKFSPDGKLVVASDFFGMIRLWNVRTSRMVVEWKAHQDAIFGVVFTPNGRGLVTTGKDQKLKYWDLGTPGFGDSREVTEVSKFVGYTGRIRSVAISPDGRWLISGSGDRGTVRILDMIDASPQCVLGGQHKVWSVDFCSTSGYVACGYEGGNVSVWRYYEPSIA